MQAHWFSSRINRAQNFTIPGLIVRTLNVTANGTVTNLRSLVKQSSLSLKAQSLATTIHFKGATSRRQDDLAAVSTPHVFES